MLTFLKYLLNEETGTHHVMSFGNFNPPSAKSHGKIVDSVKKLARENNASHEIVMSHFQDHTNPLSSEQKLKHAKRMFPDTNFTLASDDKPEIFHHLSNAYSSGHRHLTVVVGGKEKHKQVNKIINDFNGRAGSHGYYKFKSLNVVNVHDNDPDKEHHKKENARNNDFESFSKDMPKHMSLAHKKELFKDVRKGFGHND